MTLTAQSIVFGWKAIGNVFGVSTGVVRKWAEAGAPVVTVNSDVPCVAVPELWDWLKARGGKTVDAQGVSSESGGEAAGMETLYSGQGREPEKESLICREEKTAHARRECPYCGTAGTLRRHGGGWRCDWCRQRFTWAEGVDAAEGGNDAGPKPHEKT